MGSHVNHDDIRRVLDSIRQIVQALRLSSAQSERKVGLSAAQMFVLQKLGDGESISVNELAERTHTHQSSVSVVVQRLVDQRLVRRAASAADGRRVELTITAAGQRKLRSAPQAAQDKLIASLSAMSSTDRRKLAGLLARFVAGTGLADSAPTLFFEDNSKRKGSASRHGR